MIKQIIGLYGNRCVGKDTFCRALQEVDTHIDRYAFADELKHDLAPLFRQQWGVDIFNISPEMKEKLRPLLITYGMIWRAQDELHWVKKVLANITVNKCEKVCITDVRFPNEHDYLKELYGDKYQLLGLKREGAPEGTDEEKKHEVEMQKRVYVYIDLPNVKDYTELEIVADGALEYL
jgi:hypothetical protein